MLSYIFKCRLPTYTQFSTLAKYPSPHSSTTILSTPLIRFHLYCPHLCSIAYFFLQFNAWRFWHEELISGEGRPFAQCTLGGVAICASSVSGLRRSTNGGVVTREAYDRSISASDGAKGGVRRHGKHRGEPHR